MAIIGRPKIQINDNQLRALLQMKPSLKNTASFFECSEDTIENYIRDNYDMTFSEFREQNLVHTRLRLIQKAIDMAESGNVPMLIFSLKNLCDWTDKVDIAAIQPDKTIKLAYENKPGPEQKVIDVTSTE